MGCLPLLLLYSLPSYFWFSNGFQILRSQERLFNTDLICILFPCILPAIRNGRPLPSSHLSFPPTLLDSSEAGSDDSILFFLIPPLFGWVCLGTSQTQLGGQLSLSWICYHSLQKFDYCFITSTSFLCDAFRDSNVFSSLSVVWKTPILMGQTLVIK